MARRRQDAGKTWQTVARRRQDAARRLAIVLPLIMNTSCWPRHHHSHSRTRQLRNTARRARTRSLPAVATRVHNPLAQSHMWRRNRSHRRTEAQPSLLTTVYEMVYGLRPRKPVRRDPLLCQVYDALPTDVLRHIMLMCIAMPHQYNLRSRRRGITATQAATAPRPRFYPRESPSPPPLARRSLRPP